MASIASLLDGPPRPRKRALAPAPPGPKRAKHEPSLAALSPRPKAPCGKTAARPPRSPGSPARLAAATATQDRFARSRTVGQTHRDKQRVEYKEMDVEVDILHSETNLLSGLVTTTAAPAGHRAGAHVARVSHADRVVAPPNLAAIVGERALTPALVGGLLELLAARRNMTAAARAPRRRPGLVGPADPARIAAAVEVARDNFAEEAPGGADAGFGALVELHDRMQMFQAENNAADAEDHLDRPPPVPEVPSGRGKGAKKCSRCNKFKSAGSGHGRSKCDDHQLISSRIPYPAPMAP